MVYNLQVYIPRSESTSKQKKNRDFKDVLFHRRFAQIYLHVLITFTCYTSIYRRDNIVAGSSCRLIFKILKTDRVYGAQVESDRIIIGVAVYMKLL